jgi:RNA polymerase sigma factor (sigma-70 family)
MARALLDGRWQSREGNQMTSSVQIDAITSGTRTVTEGSHRRASKAPTFPFAGTNRHTSKLRRPDATNRRAPNRSALGGAAHATAEARAATALRGSPVAYILLIHQKDLINHARWLTANEHDAWDLFQDTTVRVLSCRVTAPARMSKAWLRRVMYNLFVDRCRTQKVRARSEAQQQLHDCSPPAPESDLPSVWELLPPGSLEPALQKLPPSSRIVFAMYAAGIPYSEIASQLGISINTVGTRLVRSRHKLRQVLLTTLAATAQTAAASAPLVTDADRAESAGVTPRGAVRACVV